MGISPMTIEDCPKAPKHGVLRLETGERNRRNRSRPNPLANSLSSARQTLYAEQRRREFLQTLMTDSGRTDGFCYGQKQVDSVLKWTGSSSQAEVTYTYKIANLAAWAKRSDIQQTFPAITTVLNGASRDSETAGLQLTSGGWQVPQP